MSWAYPFELTPMFEGDTRGGLPGLLMANRRFTSQFLYQFEVMPVLLSCNFIVDSTNADGIRSLKGEGIDSVYMHTNISPSAGNPNPTEGIILVNFSDPYNRYLSHFSGIINPANPNTSTAVTAGVAVIITNLGTASAAQWQAVGLSSRVTPAVGVSFVPTATATIGGSAEVANSIPGNVADISIVGDPSLTISQGRYIILRNQSQTARGFTGTTHSSTLIDGIGASVVSVLLVGMAISGAGIPEGARIASIASATSITISQAATASATVPIAVYPSVGLQAPVDGTTLSLSFYLSNSANRVKGQ